MKALKIIIIAIPILFILWIVGLFNGLKLTPNLHEDYYIGDHGLDQRMTLSYPNEELFIQIMDRYGDTVAIDVTIFPAYGQDHLLTINKLSAKVIVDGKALDTLHHYVYNSEGLQTAIVNDSASSYVQERYVYNLSGIKKFTLDVDADYVYNDSIRQFKQSYEVNRTRKLLWRGLNLGGHH